jgi:hypothetical protein
MLSPIARRELRDKVTAPRTSAPWRPVGWQAPRVSLADLQRVVNGLKNLDQVSAGTAACSPEPPATTGAGQDPHRKGIRHDPSTRSALGAVADG